MSALEHALLTAADYQRMTPEFGMGPRYQLVEGELLQMSAPNRFHQEISINLCLLIGNHIRQNRLGVLYASPFDVYLDDNNVFQPDLVFVSRERAAVLVPEGIAGAPDLVIEILSPSTAALDRRQKRRGYARVGTGELWLIDPEKRTVELYELRQNAEHPALVLDLAEEGIIESACFPGLRIALSDIFTTQLG